MNKLRTIIQILALCAVTFIISGCGDDDDWCDQPPPPPPFAEILSVAAYDGDIARDPGTGLYTVSQGNKQSVFTGKDPSTNVEFRAFIDFPLREAGGVPDNAVIDYAFLDIVINSILPQPLVGTIPIRIDLVEFQPPTLEGYYFDRTLLPALATTVIPPISQTNFGDHVWVDVTPLMIEAQRLHLVNFQLRIMEDSGGATPGLIEINDTTGENREVLAPYLQVTYF